MNPLLTFLRAAPWPNLTAMASVIISCVLWSVSGPLRAEGHALGTLLVFPALGWLALAAIAWLDGLARMLDYRRIHAILSRYGFDRRVFQVVCTSRCQRDAALFAAKKAGCLAEAQKAFRSMGYRWYHLLPDPVVDNPFKFFNIQFLRQAFLPRGM